MAEMNRNYKKCWSFSQLDYARNIIFFITMKKIGLSSQWRHSRCSGVYQRQLASFRKTESSATTCSRWSWIWRTSSSRTLPSFSSYSNIVNFQNFTPVCENTKISAMEILKRYWWRIQSFSDSCKFSPFSKNI